MTENISPGAASRRESARTSSGKFGTQPAAEAEIDLTGKRPPSTEWPYERGDGTFLIRENVTVDAALRQLPSYRDPYSTSSLQTSHIYDGPRQWLLTDVADHLQSLGGGSMRVVSNGGTALPSYVETTFQDPELGEVKAKLRVASGLTMEWMSAADTDLAGHPRWEEFTRCSKIGSSNSAQNLAAGLRSAQYSEGEQALIESVTDPAARWQVQRTIGSLRATGFAPEATAVDTESQCVVYDLAGGNQLEAVYGPRTPSYQVSLAQDDVTGGTDHAFITDSWGSSLDPADQRTVVDATLSSYVFADAMSQAGHEHSELVYGTATVAQPAGHADHQTVTIQTHGAGTTSG
jgi:hypothetical protein